jgi:hypothetical protein
MLSRAGLVLLALCAVGEGMFGSVAYETGSCLWLGFGCWSLLGGLVVGGRGLWLAVGRSSGVSSPNSYVRLVVWCSGFSFLEWSSGFLIWLYI